MFVRWQWWNQRKRGSVRFYRDEPAAAHAVLVESVRVDGKPRQKHVAYLGSVHREPDVQYRAWWWHHMTDKLDALGNRLTDDQRLRIEAALAKKVPKVTDAAEVTAFDLAHQHKIRVEHEYGECRGCYLSWPDGQAGVPPRPAFVDEPPDWSNVIAAIEGQ